MVPLSSPIKERKIMAHLIKLHTAGQNQEILFNLDTIVSAERTQSAAGEEFTFIQTRWGQIFTSQYNFSHASQNVKETLEEILEKSKEL